jgi:hypothetical protein
VSNGREVDFDKLKAIFLREARGAKKHTMSEPFGVVAQLAEQPPFKRAGCRFEPDTAHVPHTAPHTPPPACGVVVDCPP